MSTITILMSTITALMSTITILMSKITAIMSTITILIIMLMSTIMAMMSTMTILMSIITTIMSTIPTLPLSDGTKGQTRLDCSWHRQKWSSQPLPRPLRDLFRIALTFTSTGKFYCRVLLMFDTWHSLHFQTTYCLPENLSFLSKTILSSWILDLFLDS